MTLVTIFGESVPLRPLDIVRPDVYVKGGDYAIETLPEAKLDAVSSAEFDAFASQPALHQ